MFPNAANPGLVRQPGHRGGDQLQNLMVLPDIAWYCLTWLTVVIRHYSLIIYYQTWSGHVRLSPRAKKNSFHPFFLLLWHWSCSFSTFTDYLHYSIDILQRLINSRHNGGLNLQSDECYLILRIQARLTVALYWHIYLESYPGYVATAPIGKTPLQRWSISQLHF